MLPAVGEELLGTTSLFRNEVAMRGLFQSLDKFRRLTSKVLVASHSASCTGLEKAPGRAAVTAALLRRAQLSDHSTEMRSPVTFPATSKRKLPEGS